ncbi:hypothetical protein IWW47_002755 [Coemansia sp. RSA 2052]|nr:hypothetical protein IWW47_002755 [Coemansia sp. RSA 2052]
MYRYEPPSSSDCLAIDRALSLACQTQWAEDIAANKDTSERYLRQFISATRRPLAKTSDNEPDCSIVYGSNDNSSGADLDEAELYLMRLRKMPMKLIHFHGSQRPDYWGTWSRKLCGVGARRPFGRDATELDYDIDSDAEWEAEEEGEDLRSEDDDDEDDDEDSDDDDDDDFDEQRGFIVGDSMPRVEVDDQTLSGDEGSGADTDTGEESNFNSEDEEMEDIDPSEEVCDDGMDVDEPVEPIVSRRRVATAVDSTSSIDTAHPSTHSIGAKSKLHTRDEKKRDHQPSRRVKVQPLTPVVVGLAWHQGDKAPAASVLDKLTVHTTGLALPLHISVAAQDIQPMRQAVSSSLGKGDSSAGASARKSWEVTDADMHILIGVVHGSSFGIARLVEMLRPQIPGANKAQIERLIHEHAIKEKRPPATRPMWYVKEQLVEQARASRHISDNSEPPHCYADSLVVSAAAVDAPATSETEESVSKRQRISETTYVA